LRGAIVTDDYPRSEVADDEDRVHNGQPHAEVIRVTYEPSRTKLPPSRPFSEPKFLVNKTLTITKYYDHQVSTGIGARSRGFVWFFSFVAWYSQVKRAKQNVILLLDEPGLTLHGRGQGASSILDAIPC
jgi:hypothetical protein